MQRGGEIQKTAHGAGVQSGVPPKRALANKLLESLTLTDVMMKMPRAAHIALKRLDGADRQEMRKVVEVVAGYLELLEQGRHWLQYSQTPAVFMDIMQLVDYFMPELNIEMILIKPPSGACANYEREVELIVGPQMNLVTLAFASRGTVEKDGGGNHLYIKGMYLASHIVGSRNLGIWMDGEREVHPKVMERVESAYRCPIEVYQRGDI